MQAARYWQRIDHTDLRALEMADRHYSRRSPGTPEFVAAGHKVVLMHFTSDGMPAALWVSHRPAPNAGLARPRFDGLDVWDCSMFRVEQRTVVASELIKEAVAITCGLWTPLPVDGFYTTIDPRYVKSQGRKRGYGWCYQVAGWLVLPERTRARGLIQLVLPLDALTSVSPITAPLNVPEFGVAWRRWPRKVSENQMNLFALEDANAL